MAEMRVFAAAAALVLIGGAGVRASDLFVISANTTSGASHSVTASGSDVTDLVTHLVRSQDQFQSFKNRDVSATLDYGGIGQAVAITENAAGTSATVRVPSIGFTKTFTASNRDALKNQIIDYVKKNGASEYAKFLRVVDTQTPAGVTDGNPLAATALLADHVYQVFGIEPAPFPLERPSGLEEVVTPRFRLDLGGGVVNTSRGSGYFATGALDVGFRFTDRVGLVLSSPFTYHTLEGANVFDASEEVSVPISILPPRGSGGLSWTVTPSGLAGAAGSIELAAGGTFAGGGVTSSLSYQLGAFTFTLADHYSYYKGYPIDIAGYHFHTDLEQQVLKNGFKVTRSFGDRVLVDAGVTYTNFLERAAIDHYWSPTAGVSLRISRHAGLRVGYEGDLRRGFNVNGGTINLYVNY